MFNSIEHGLLSLLGLGNHPAAPKATADGMSARQLPGPVARKQAQLDYLPAQQKMMVPGSQPVGLSVQPAYTPRQGAGWNGLQQSTSFDGRLQGYDGDINGGFNNPLINNAGGDNALQGNTNGYFDTSYAGGNDPASSYYGVNQQGRLNGILNRY